MVTKTENPDTFLEEYTERLKKLSEVDKAWLAGLFDGEGTIRITNKPKVGGRKIYIRIANTHIPTLQKIQSLLGGCLIPNRNFTYRHSCAWYWHKGDRPAMQVLKVLLPYLVTKLEQAMIAIDFQEWKTYLRTQHMPYKKLPDWYYREADFWAGCLEVARGRGKLREADYSLAISPA